MATLTQIILIVACACAVNCRHTRGRPHKLQSSPSPVDHQLNPTQTRDSDAVIFPSDDDDVKKIDAIIVNSQVDDSNVAKAITDPRVDAPLISKIVPDVEVKDVFTNPVVENIDKANDKNVNEKDKIINQNEDKEVATIAISTDVIQGVINDNNGTEIKTDDAANANMLSSRFGSTGHGNYMLVPVANNQNYQPIQTNANVPYYNTQGVIAQPTNTFAANVGSNIGPNQYTPSVGLSHYANGQQAPNVFPSHLNSNMPVPVNVPNTYVINGQLYAAVTLSNNMEVMSPLYYANPQTTAYQVQNNVPLYKLVTVDQGVSAQVNNLNNINSNSQFVSS